MSKLDDLDPKRKRFVEEYLVDLNGTQAAIRAGYSAKSAYSQAHDLLRKPEIEAAVIEEQAARSERTKISADRVVTELAKVAFANMMDFIRIGADGEPFVDLTNLTRAQAAALAEFSVEDFKDGRGEDARDVRRVRIKLADKLKPLDLLGRHLGVFRKGDAEEGDVPGLIEAKAAEEKRELEEIAARYLPKPKPKPKQIEKPEKEKVRSSAA